MGIDIEESGRLRENKSPNIWFDGENIPFEDEKFDFVMATEVLEHAENPSQLFGEMIRCLKTGGTVLITVPTTWALHEEPYDFMRLTPYGVAKLGQKHGLRPIEVGGETRGLSAIRKILLSEIKRSRLSPVKEKFARALAKGFVKLLGSVSPDFSNALVITSYGVFEKHDS